MWKSPFFFPKGGKGRKSPKLQWYMKLNFKCTQWCWKIPTCISRYILPHHFFNSLIFASVYFLQFLLAILRHSGFYYQYILQGIYASSCYEIMDKTKVSEEGKGGQAGRKKANFCRLVRKVPSSKRVLEKGQEQRRNSPLVMNYFKAAVSCKRSRR